MWPFRRKDTSKDNVPLEVQQYYKSERRDRIGLAWLLAGLTLIATVIIAAALFYSGRWAYRKITHKENKPTTTQTASTDNQQTQQNPQSNQGQGSSGSGQSSTSQGNVAAPTETNQPSTTPTQPTQTTTPSTSSSKLSNTGPGDTIAIFAVVSIVAALGHAAYSRRFSKS